MESTDSIHTDSKHCVCNNGCGLLLANNRISMVETDRKWDHMCVDVSKCITGTIIPCDDGERLR